MVKFLIRFFKRVLIEIKSFKKVFFFLFCLFYDFWNLNPSNLDLSRTKIKVKEKKFFHNFGANRLRKFYELNFLLTDSFLESDIFWAKQMGKKYLLKNREVKTFRSYFRSFSTKQGFYFVFKKLKNIQNFQHLLTYSYLSGFKFIWLGIRFWVFPLLVFFLIVYTTLVLRALPFNKLMLGWICILMFIYWLISGFVFFF